MEIMDRSGDYTDYLPGDLRTYLDPRPKEHLGLSKATRFVLLLEDLSTSGYRRAIKHTTQSQARLVSHETFDLDTLARVFCALAHTCPPFDARLAGRIARCFNLYDAEKRYLCELCIPYFSPAAFRFLSGPFQDNVPRPANTLVMLGFHPGYVEALLGTPMAIIECECVAYVLPGTYRNLPPNPRAPNPVDDTYNAIKARNYRLARWLIKGNTPGLTVQALLRMMSEECTWQQEALAWMQEEGLITAVRDKAELQEMEPSEEDLSDS